MTTAKQERAQRRKEELQRRKDLKAKLIEKYGLKCMTCGKTHSYWFDLVHKIALSAGGLTEKSNVLLECRECHMIRHHQIKEGKDEC